MTDHAALLAAVCAASADDLVRLVYADWREDRGDTAYAEFIRSQVHLDPLPPWHPEAVAAKYRTPHLVTGAGFGHELPSSPVRGWEWPARGAFRRGLGYSVVVRDLTSFLDSADELFDHVPIGELRLPTSTLAEWRRFAGRPWLPRIESVRFYGVSTPIEPLRVLCDSPAATGLTRIALEKAGGPAVPVLLADLFETPLGRQLKRLELHAGADHGLEWLDALESVGPRHALDDLVLVTMGLSGEAVERFGELPLLPGLKRLELRNNPLAGGNYEMVFTGRGLDNVEVLRIKSVLPAIRADDLARWSAACKSLRQIDLGGSRLHKWPSAAFLHLVSIQLRHCQATTAVLRRLQTGGVWPRLVELDVRGNDFGSISLEAFLKPDPPPGLAALVFDASLSPGPIRERLRAKYGDAVVFTEPNYRPEPDA